MRIGLKVGLLVGSLVLAQAASLGAASTITVRAQAEYEQVLNQVVQESSLANRIDQEYRDQSAAWNQLLVHYHHPPEAQQAIADIRTHANQLKADLAQLKRATTDPKLHGDLDELEASHQQLTEAMTAAVPAVQAGTYNVDDPKVIALDAEVRKLVDAPQTNAQFRGQDALLALQDSQRRALNWLIWISGFLLAIPAGAAVIVARRIVAPIVALTEVASDNAERALPEAVNRIGQMTHDVKAPEMASFEVDSKDELQQLSSALTAMQASSLALAVRQRETELNAARTLVNLGRRNQNLLSRTLAYLGDLERNERDSTILTTLYRLDHGITRVRRNMESLLVLAGVDQTRATTRPASIIDVTRAALSEIEDFRRVSIGHLDSAVVAGPLTTDLTHLLAELLENSTHFSPEGKQVRVSGTAGAGEYTIAIQDDGPGLTPDALAEANRKLAIAGRALHDTDKLGHTIVGRIAERHGLTVSLENGVTGGLISRIRIPDQHLQAEPTAPQGTSTETSLVR